MRSLDIASTGMLAQQLNVDVIANNIANSSTTGYKMQRTEFEDLLYQTVEKPGGGSSSAGTITPTGIQLGLGVAAGATYRINTQGPLQETGNDFDIAISGNGYFEVQTPEGNTAYTRAGSFQVDASGQLVTSAGYVVQPGITIPNNAVSVTINGDGEVLVVTDAESETAPENPGRLTLANFLNPSGLSAGGGNLFFETPASGAPISGAPGDVGFGEVRHRFLETSNVDSVKEVTSLITAQRAYELNSRVISTSDEMLQTISQLR